ncbi:LysR family transcriptional regulator [Gordonia sp. SID5947]|uniref:SDR family oxidoreductase n=1 Tax=Gordonia sp. SID5947 TaxID=2690315 RepID=UPI001370A028|nr:SDR family oxidoreductase [Gordonia sp. SID5947]MYR08279.1 LysR family transcriptional regulator [Gordonia sp. SID5947]
MKVVIFGNGLIGGQVEAKIAAAGHDVVALGRSSGVDTTTGDGVAEAVAGADVVVDLTNSPSWRDDDVLAFFRDSTQHLLAAEQAAGVGHHVILSIVGADRLTDAGYMRAKLAQVEMVQAGPIPYSIVRSTQFFEFVAGIADAGARGDVVHATPAHLQPIASRDVVGRVSEIVVGTPVDGTVEIAGPEAIGIDELVRRLFATTGDPRTVQTDPEAGYFGAMLDDAALVPTPGADAWIAPTTFDDWLETGAPIG